MTISLRYAIAVTVALTLLLVFGMSLAAFPVSVRGQGSSSSGDATSFLESAKLHLLEATKDLKMGNSQAALTQINMTHQAITSAERQVNSSVICNNVNNEGYCVYP
jgi:ABC-type transport system involved in multi-copper enzyme maturation permease subunit